MKFYYAAIYTDLYGDDERQFYCSYTNELKKGDVVVIEYNNHFIVCIIQEPIDELTVHAQQLDVRIVLGQIEVSEYMKAKENTIKKQVLLNEMEERAKTVKLMENMKKLSNTDSEMARLYELFSGLTSLD